MDLDMSLLWWDAIKAVHYIYPSFIFAYFSAATIVSIVTLQTSNAKAKIEQFDRLILTFLMVFIALSYLIEALTIGIYDVINRTWSGEQDYNVYILSSVIVWTIPVINFSETQFPVWYSYLGCWLVGILAETFLVIVPNVLQPPKIRFDFTSTVLHVLRICALGLLACCYTRICTHREDDNNEDPERQPLLQPDPDNAAENGAESDAQSDTSSIKAREKVAARLAKDGNWFRYVKSFSIFIPLVWPVHDLKLQARALGVYCCIGTKSIVNVLMPIQFGLMTEALVNSNNSRQGPWLAVTLYTSLGLLTSGSFISRLQLWLWMPVEQYATFTLNTVSYAHVMNLSSDFHDSKSSSEVNNSLRQGRSVKELVGVMFIDIFSMLVDIGVAFIYLYILFGPYMLLTIFSTIALYLFATIKILVMRRGLRRDWVKDWQKEWTIGSEGVSGWKNAVYFNRIPYEIQRYTDVVKSFCRSELRYALAIQLLSAVQAVILSSGLTIALYIAVYQISVSKTKSLRDFITLVAYWARVERPLSFFAQTHKKVSEKLLEAEGLLELLQKKPTVFNSPTAKPLEFLRGDVVFSGVNFTYESGKVAVKDTSFHVHGGSTIAFVGETGGGKSTMLKLLSRFYDVNEGRIEIDGQDIREVTLTSLRDCIGSVPQDPTLFNDTIMNNLRYAKLDATDEEIYEATRKAAVHDKILGLPKGYKSKVGDSGVKLSGGEKQRIAIARAILKDAKIILLDEATSAVDMETEAFIQEALSNLYKDRTTIIVAHRLSTVMRADHIFVIQDGTIIEEGSHVDLIKKGGKYHDLWSRQIFVAPPQDPEHPTSPKMPLQDITNNSDPTSSTAQPSKVSETTKVGGKESSESPKLKPSTLEFVPHSSPASSEDAKELVDAPKDSNASKEEDQNAEQRELQASLAKIAAKKAGKRIARVFDSGGEGSSQPMANEKKGDENLPPSSSRPKPHMMKRNRPGRRHQSKSEPTTEATAAQARESIRRTMKGLQETEWTGNGSGDGLLPLSPAPVRLGRRVSAPGDTPSGTLRDLRGASRGGRVRRPRHWRLKKHSHDRNFSAATSESMSGSEYSTAVGVAALVITPAEASTLPTPRIRFAPGC